MEMDNITTSFYTNYKLVGDFIHKHSSGSINRRNNTPYPGLVPPQNQKKITSTKKKG